MHVKHANQVMKHSLAGRPTWKKVTLGVLRGLSSALRWVAWAPLWPWLGAAIRNGAWRLEQWVYRL